MCRAGAQPDLGPVPFARPPRNSRAQRPMQKTIGRAGLLAEQRVHNHQQTQRKAQRAEFQEPGFW